jgi:heat shock protein HslJ
MDRKKMLAVLGLFIVIGILALIFVHVRTSQAPVVPAQAVLDVNAPWGTYVASAEGHTYEIVIKNDAGSTATISDTSAGKTSTKSGSWSRGQEDTIVIKLATDIVTIKFEEDKVIVEDGGDTLPDGTAFDQQPPADGGDTTGKDGNGIAVGEVPPGTQPTDGGVPPIGTGTFDSGEYRLMSYMGREIPKDEVYTLSFEKGMIGAKFCNGFGGDYTVKAGVLIAPQLMGTQMACGKPEGLMDMEISFAAMLARGASVSEDLKEGTLTLDGGQGKIYVYARSSR